VQDNLQQILLLLNNITNNQATVTVKGEYVATPNVVVYKTPNTEIKVGKFYRPGNGDVLTGIEVTKGSDGKGCRLYPVDASRLPRGFTFTRTDTGEKRYVNLE